MLNRTLSAIVIISLLASGCDSSRRMLQNGQYDMAIKKSVHKLIRNPEKSKEYNVLSQAYKIANQKDQEKIDFMKLSGEVDIWDDILNIYSRMKLRQNIVNTAPQSILDKLNFVSVNYDSEIINAKKKAAAFFYTRAQNLLEKGSKNSAREAYDDLIKVKHLYSTYKDLDSLTNMAIILGKSNILFKVKNNSGMIIPEDFDASITKISVSDLNKQWLNFDMKKINGKEYDYYVLINIKEIEVSPETLKEIHNSESKEIEDGFTYQFDSKGNVAKDSSGNDIKIKKYKTITCKVIETQQRKAAIVSGTVEFIEVNGDQVIRSFPATVESLFENISYTTEGDVKALSTETKKKIGNQPVPFPSGNAMILMAADILKDKVKEVVNKNSSLFY